MPTPNPITWITPAGSLGWIPDSVFYQTTLLASTPLVDSITISATFLSTVIDGVTVTNVIVCDDTSELYRRASVIFTGTSFGGILPNVNYYVKDILSTTAFTISALPYNSAPSLTLTTATGTMTGNVYQSIYYEIIAGELPNGIQCALNGVVSGIPSALASIQGVPLPVGSNKTFKWTVQAYTEIEVNGVEIRDRINDRTFEITVVVSPGPNFVTPAGLIGNYYDSDEVDFQFEFNEPYEPDDTFIELVNGHLPGGLILTPLGRLYGYIQPTPDVTALPGYSQPNDPYDTEPYDFVGQFLSKNFQFTLRVTNGKKSNLRTFSIFVYSRDQMSADDAALIDNNTFITADQTQERAPFISNSQPTDLGVYRSENYFAYQFIGQDYDTSEITYALSVNQGYGLPPGLTLDPISGWYYGYIPDQGTTEVTYSFNISVYQTNPITPAITCLSTASNVMITQSTGKVSAGQPLIFATDFAGLSAGVIYYVDSVLAESAETNTTSINIQGQTLSNAVGPVSATLAIECTSSSASTNELTCFNTDLLGIGQPIVFSGTSFGSVSVDAQTVYYVHSISGTGNEFTIATSPNAASPLLLDNGSGSMVANMILSSRLYPYSLTITGAIDAEVSWITPPDSSSYYRTINGVSTLIHNLGSIENGGTSRFYVEAENRGGRTLAYRLKSGAYNELPQGLQLLPTGEIAGRVSFDTFALDLGATTFDESLIVNRDLESLGTTFDSTFVFTVNAYAPENTQIIYKVASITVDNGGTGYSAISTPTIEFSTPVGASAIRAEVGNVTVVSGAITNVAVADQGDGYVSTATVGVTQGFGGSGAILTAVMEPSGTRDVVSVFRTCSIKVVRRYNKPYQNLYIRAMPPPSDRDLINQLLDNSAILIPEYLYRPNDPNFGKSRQVTYYHAFGLEPDTLDQYVLSLYENHYFKNLTLGEIQTAQAIDPVTQEVVYEVVYSKIIDDLVNDAGQSVSKIVNLPYPIVDPADGSTIVTQVYPNSLINMRNQVIDVVGSISSALPLWMTSKQTNGRVLGFTPAWIICYTKPGRSDEIAYFIDRYYGQQLNRVDFEVDRYILDRVLSRNWNTESQRWTPTASLTTFDRFSVGEKTFIGTVDIGTNLAYSDVNNRTLEYVNALGGLDGIIFDVDNNTIVFVKQENYNGPPGSSYATTDQAWQNYTAPFDSGSTTGSPGSFDASDFDESFTVPGGDVINCTNTIGSTDTVVCDDTNDMRAGQPIRFTSGVFGGIVANQQYYVLSVDSSTTFKVTDSPTSTTAVNLSTAAGSMVGEPANERMAIYRISVTAEGILQLNLIDQTYENNYIQITRGNEYRSDYVYYPGSPGIGLSRINWQSINPRGSTAPFIVGVAYEIVQVGNTSWTSIGASANQVGVRFTATGPGSGTGVAQSLETTFDQTSLAFVEPVDMYDPTDTIDKYLVFPKQNILV